MSADVFVLNLPCLQKSRNPLFEAAKPLIEFTLGRVVPRDYSDRRMSREDIVRDFRTIKLSASRRTGHTSAIPLIVNHFFKGTVIVTTPLEPSNLRRYLSDCSRTRLTTIYNLERDILGLGEIDAIIVDNFGSLNPANILNLYETSGDCFARNNQFILILIG